MKSLALVTDAFGGRGGIAKYNRDLLTALCEYDVAAQVLAIPRHVVEPIDATPLRVSYIEEASKGKLSYLRHACTSAMATRYDVVVCAHVNLLPLATLLAGARQVPLVLTIHGIEAWEPHPRWQVRALLPFVSAVASVSEFTKQRFASWAGAVAERIRVIPNTIDLSRYRPGARNQQLAAKLNLDKRAVIMTLGRLSRLERYKGVDEVLEAIPSLVTDIPNLTYLVVGDGDDRARLEEKARSLGIGDHVVFSGYVSETEKADYYRLANVFVMPSRGEGFGIVFLEAIACGLPVIASTADASMEVIRGGRLGSAVDPSDRTAIAAAIRSLILCPPAIDRSALLEYSYERFRDKWRNLLGEVLQGKLAPQPPTEAELAPVTRQPREGTQQDGTSAGSAPTAAGA